MTFDEAVKAQRALAPRHGLLPIGTDDGEEFYVVLTPHVYTVTYQSCGSDYKLSPLRPLTAGVEEDERYAYALFMSTGIDPLAEFVEGCLL